ncbi:DNA repair protein RecO, partial [Corynebacterium sp.]|uniref:DNA repair protein RecO n=1 Tax=Corynebacterium sp. TaxID=1720 RepID=UPI002A919385
VAYFGAGIIDDYDRYTAACAIMETAEKLSYSDLADAVLFDATSDALSRLQGNDHPTLVLDAFILRATANSGWGLSLFECANCGTPGPHAAFSPSLGGAVCTTCRPPGAMDVDPEVLHTMWLIQNGRAATAEHAERVHRATTAHLQWHVESAVRSLKIMEQA